MRSENGNENGKKSKLRILIIVLTVFLVCELTVLAVIVIEKYSNGGDTVVIVSGNTVNPASESSASSVSSASSSAAPTSSETASGGTGKSSAAASSAASGQTACVVSLYRGRPDYNNAFKVTNMLPGDACTQYYQVKVAHSGEVVLRFHASVRAGSEKLAEVLKIRVTVDGSGTLYDGLIGGMPKSLNVTLKAAGGSAEPVLYRMTAYLDTSVGNEYADRGLAADFSWWVEETDRLDNSPDLGAAFNYVLWTAVALSFLIASILVFGLRRKGEEHE